jgi:tetratricopeptide (TPR) repeat protein
MFGFVRVAPLDQYANRTEYSVLSTQYRAWQAAWIPCFAAFVLLLLAALSPRHSLGQEDASGRLMDQVPFDILRLDKANENKVYRVYPVQLPGRRVPEKPRASEKLRVRLVDTGEEYDVAWQHIEKLELFESLVLEEVRKFTSAGRLDDAYDTLGFLLGFYPQTPGLADARQTYLYASSGAAFRQQKYDEALALLEELIALNPNFRTGEAAATLVQRLGVIADRLIATHVEAQEYRAARALLTRLAKQYKADGEPFAKKWRDELTALAAARLAEAQGHLEAGRYVQAQDAATLVQAIWPEVAGARELAAEVARRHPLVRVGVEHPALSFDLLSLHDAAARRAGRLRQRLLVERTALGLEGGKYESPLAALARSDDGLSLTFRLASPASPRSYSIAQQLLSRAVPGNAAYDAPWARLVAGVALRGADEVQVDFRWPPVLPEALLQIPPAGVDAAADEAYSVISREAAATRWAVNSASAFYHSGQPAEIIERYYSDPQRALLALKRGEIDVLDHLFPGDIPGLKSDASLAVAAYLGPTTHVLVVRSPDVYLQKAAFRRALVYGANRELLLGQGLLRGATVDGFRVVSSPFPAPAAGLELPTYGYDEQIEPRPYDPRLGMALVLLAEGEVKSAYQKQEQQPPARRALLLGHPADESSRIACRGLVKDWKRIGVEAKLTEFAAGVFDDVEQKCDLVYLQLAAWEPLVDAGRLWGPAGLAPASAPALRLALREIETARNWQEARRRLTTLHRLVAEEMTVLPLWQTIDHFAYRRGVVALDARRLSLYQDIEQWRPAASPARSQP